MKKSVLLSIGIACAALASGLANTAPASAYAGQESRQIKAISPEDVDAYLSGKGMGLAKAAELNGYPGPSHVLALAGELGLSADQKQRTESLFKSMESKAIPLGRRFVEEERKLDRMFADKTVTRDALAKSLKRLGALQAQVRQTHLETHLAQAEILTPAQTAKYMELRGYAGTAKAEGHAGHQH
jgi:Spy/CpxP family protein refolding chaperone